MESVPQSSGKNKREGSKAKKLNIFVTGVSSRSLFTQGSFGNEEDSAIEPISNGSSFSGLSHGPGVE